MSPLPAPCWEGPSCVPPHPSRVPPRGGFPERHRQPFPSSPPGVATVGRGLARGAISCTGTGPCPHTLRVGTSLCPHPLCVGTAPCPPPRVPQPYVPKPLCPGCPHIPSVPPPTPSECKGRGRTPVLIYSSDTVYTQSRGGDGHGRGHAPVPGGGSTPVQGGQHRTRPWGRGEPRFGVQHGTPSFGMRWCTLLWGGRAPQFGGAASHPALGCGGAPIPGGGGEHPALGRSVSPLLWVLGCPAAPTCGCSGPGGVRTGQAQAGQARQARQVEGQARHLTGHRQLGEEGTMAWQPRLGLALLQVPHDPQDLLACPLTPQPPHVQHRCHVLPPAGTAPSGLGVHPPPWNPRHRGGTRMDLGEQTRTSVREWACTRI